MKYRVDGRYLLSTGIETDLARTIVLVSLSVLIFAAFVLHSRYSLERKNVESDSLDSEQTPFLIEHTTQHLGVFTAELELGIPLHVFVEDIPVFVNIFIHGNKLRCMSIAENYCVLEIDMLDMEYIERGIHGDTSAEVNHSNFFSFVGNKTIVIQTKNFDDCERYINGFSLVLLHAKNTAQD